MDFLHTSPMFYWKFCKKNNDAVLENTGVVSLAQVLATGCVGEVALDEVVGKLDLGSWKTEGWREA